MVAERWEFLYEHHVDHVQPHQQIVAQVLETRHVDHYHCHQAASVQLRFVYLWRKETFVVAPELQHS